MVDTHYLICYIGFGVKKEKQGDKYENKNQKKHWK